MIRLPPLHALVAFEAAARLGGFAAAAEELCITASAVSHRLRTLEAWLGTPLFQRGHRRVELTAEGERYLREVRQALHDIECASRRLNGHARRVLRLSVAPGIGAKWVVGQIGAYRADHPEIEFALASSSSPALLRTGAADIGLVYGDPPWAGLEAFELQRQKVFPVCAPARATPLGRTPRPEALFDMPLLRHPLLPWRPWLDAAGLPHDEPADGDGPSFDDAMLMLEAAAAGAGMALTVDLLARPYLQAGLLVRPFETAIRGKAFHALVAPESLTRPEVKAFIRWLQRRARDEQVTAHDHVDHPTPSGAR